MNEKMQNPRIQAFYLSIYSLLAMNAELIFFNVYCAMQVLQLDMQDVMMQKTVVTFVASVKFLQFVTARLICFGCL